MSSSIEFKIKKYYNALTKSERQAADFILENIGNIHKLSIVDAAAGAGVSQPTIIRFLRTIGYKGYKEFKLAAVSETVPKSQSSPLYGFDINKNDNIEDIPSKIIATSINKLENTLKALSVESYKEAVSAIKNAERVVIFYVENSVVTAYDLMTKLVYLGINCVVYDDYYLQSVSANSLGENDIAIAISYSGCSKNTVDVLKTAGKKGAKSLVITNFEDSVISKYGDIVLSCDNEQFLYGDAIFSRSSQIVIVDMLYMGIILSDYEHYTEILENNSRLIRSRAYISD